MNEPAHDPHAAIPKGVKAPAVYARDREHYVPGLPALSGWTAALQNGSAVSGLLAHRAEHAAAALGGKGWVMSRHSVDLCRPVRYEPAQVQTEVVRDGQRLRLIEGRMVIDGVVVARSSTLVLRPPSAKPAASADLYLLAPGHCAPGPLVPWRRTREDAPIPFEAYCECRWATDFEDGSPAVWLTSPSEIVEGEPASFSARAVAVADLMAALAAVHRARTDGRPFTPFVNADLHVSLFRAPISAFVALRLTRRDSFEGVELAEARLYDEVGACGLATQTRIAQPMHRRS